MQYLPKDLKIIAREKQLRDRYISFNFWTFIIVVLGTLAFQTIDSKPPIIQEAAWKCQGCQYRVWVRDPDMWGNYYCPRCHTKK